MAKEFNIQGGYFSPPGYLKVETGGSHDENPNGGVQIGVDPNGIPNMLEEGEPVYDDYVYSDNITADKAILEQFHIPEKYAGKLYSEIADTFVDEAEDRPLDPISNNGLRSMLGRLADAQEQQKQNQEQKELEDELANMSPEELAELEAMLAEQGIAQQQAQGQEVVEQNAIPVEQQQIPVMATGGPFRRRLRGYMKDTLYDLQHGKSMTKSERDKLKAEELQSEINSIFRAPTLQEIKGFLRGEPWGQKKYVLDTLIAFPGIKDPNIKLEKGPAYIGVDDGAKLELYDFGGPMNKFDGGSWMTRLVPDNLATMRYKLRNGTLPDIKPLAIDRSLFADVPLPAVTTEPEPEEENMSSNFDTLPTWMRYTGALGHGLLALGNAVTPQTRFTSRQARPYYPTGRINLIDPTYNPIDFGLTENAILASGAGTVNALRNSGLGPSTAASIIAADRNLGQNLGMGFLQNWNANNQQRNDVIAARNSNATQRANFNYQVEAARARALDNAQRFNIQNDLYLQRLNDNAESQKYAAISGELGYGLDALTKMGDENMAFNMVNSTSDYGYDDKSGRVRYKRKASNGGTLLKKYKK